MCFMSVFPGALFNSGAVTLRSWRAVQCVEEKRSLATRFTAPAGGR
jgi:hypothetical protein